MRFPPQFLDDVKARLPVSEVVRRRVRLVKAGREWKGLSPFSAEKTPSFFVNDQKMAWFDFSSGQNGDIFNFLELTEGLSFPEAVERLAAEAGLQPPRASPEALEQEKKRVGLHEVLAGAAAFFRAQLSARGGAKARDYLARRGLGEETQARFGLGYAPADKFALRDHLAAKGATREAMIEAGLLVHGEDVAVPYDRFRDRLIFPICDRSGRPIAFGGRALEDGVQPKYLNSPETPLFHKGSVLFNHHLARLAAHQAGRLIVVEGYVDVAALAQAGVGEAVAPLGTALTPEQAELAWRMSEEPILCFDGDRAGRKAAWRAIDMALPLIGPERSFRFAFLPDGQDPDDLLRASGREALEETLSRALPLVDAVWTRESEASDLSTPERRAAFEGRLEAIAAQIRDERLRRHYRDAFRARRNALFAPPRTEPRRDARAGGRGAGARERPAGPIVAGPSLSASALMQPQGASLGAGDALILLILVNHPALVERRIEEVAELEFSWSEGAALRDLAVAAAGEGSAREKREDAAAELRAAIEARGLSPALARCEALAGLASHWYARPDAAEADAEKVLDQAILHRRAAALNKDLADARRAFEAAPTEVNWTRFRDLQEQLRARGGLEASVDGFGVPSGRRSGGL